MDGENNKKQLDKYKIKFYNCQKLGHFADECELLKGDKSKGKEKMLMTEEDEDKHEESSLLMVLANEHTNILLQGVSGYLKRRIHEVVENT